MKILHLISKLIAKRKSNTTGKRNAPFMETDETASSDDVFFEVSGAGKIAISKGCHAHTGRSFGFDFGVSWGQYGYCGGVLDREVAKQLAEFILAEYDKITPEIKMEEQAYLKERDTRLQEYFANKE